MKVETLKDCEGKDITINSMIAFYQGNDDQRDFSKAKLMCGMVYEMWNHPIFGESMNVRILDEAGNPTGYECVTPGCALVITPDNAYFASFILRRAARVNIPNPEETLANAD